VVLHQQREVADQLAALMRGLDVGVEIASSGTDAMRRIRSRTPHVIIAGHRPPELDAPAFLEATIAHAPEALRIALVESPDDAVELDFRPTHAGTIIRFVARPHERSRLMALISESVKLIGLIEESRTLTRRLASEHKQLQRRQTLLDVVVKERTHELEVSYERLKAANRQALFGLAEAIEAKDPYTKGHCGRVAAYTLVLAREAGYPDDGLETLEFGAFLHDIGKIGIKDAVLLKPGPLDDAEWIHMREHPIKGYEIANKIEMLKPIMSAVRNHHERWDGSGYPDKLVGEAIPLAARLVAIADAFDAMITDRPYKAGMPYDECKIHLRKQAGKMFDPDLIETFILRGVGELYLDPVGDDDYGVPSDSVLH
jgi:putative nucleotidyltransferase with HDIG domain